MSETTESTNPKGVEASPEVQFKILMERAKIMGLKVSPNIGLETLRAKVRAAQEAENASAADDVPDGDENMPRMPQAGAKENAESEQQEDEEEPPAPPAIAAELEQVRRKPVKEETENQKRARLRKEATKLVRIRLTCMNPNKKDLPGEIFTIGNRYIGTVRKFVPYVEQPDGYHVENCIFEELKNRKFLNIRTDKKGIPQTNYVPEFAIEVLPQLTQKELRALAQRQAMANGTGETTAASE